MAGFQPHLGTPVSMPGYYESEQALSEYLLFHYGSPREVLPWESGPVSALNYPARCVSEGLDPGRLPAGARALDLGCAVGRSSFELARHCGQVVGIDYSAQFIAVADTLRRDGRVSYRHVEEGDLRMEAAAEVPPGIDRARVVFEQGDAHALRDGLGSFDVVLMANLVDRLADPARCLAGLPGLVRTGGQLILTTPCTWREEHTPRSHWLGGRIRDGVPLRTLESLRGHLDAEFLLERTWDMPFLIREHARKYQWSVALATLWTRR